MAGGGYRPGSGRKPIEDTGDVIPTDPMEELAHLRNLVAFLQTNRDQLKCELADKQRQIDHLRKQRDRAQVRRRKLMDQLDSKEKKSGPRHSTHQG
jgi:chromosome segregation ATPase